MIHLYWFIIYRICMFFRQKSATKFGSKSCRICLTSGKSPNFFGENMNGNGNKFTWLKMRFFLNWFPHFLFYFWFFVQFFGSFSSFFKFILLLILCSTLQLLFLSLEQSNIKWEAFSFSPLSAWISAIHSFAHYFISFYW